MVVVRRLCLRPLLRGVGFVCLSIVRSFVPMRRRRVSSHTETTASRTRALQRFRTRLFLLKMNDFFILNSRARGNTRSFDFDFNVVSFHFVDRFHQSWKIPHRTRRSMKTPIECSHARVSNAYACESFALLRFQKFSSLFFFLNYEGSFTPPTCTHDKSSADLDGWMDATTLSDGL